MSRQNLLPNGSGRKNEPPPLWEDPEPTTPRPTPQAILPHEARRLKYLKQYPNSLPTDVLEWLSLNKPQSFEELMDLRKTLYSRKSCFGTYFITQRGHTKHGEEKFVLNGPGGSVLILSNKCRHYLLRTLNRLRRSKRWPPIAYR